VIFRGADRARRWFRRARRGWQAVSGSRMQLSSLFGMRDDTRRCTQVDRSVIIRSIAPSGRPAC